MERGDIKSRIGESWNFWGNVLFVLGSVGYVVTAIMTVYKFTGKEYDELNFFLSILFIVDSILYGYGLNAGETSQTSRPEGAVSWFRSSIDWYSLATMLFMLGSVLYFISALMVKLHADSQWVNFVNLLGGLTFAIDGPLYLASGLQFRDRSAFTQSNAGASPSPFKKSFIGKFTFNR